MHDASPWVVLGSLFLAGLTGSLHCIGMCGPILFSFSQVFQEGARRRGQASPTLGFDFLWYHTGRIWTYGVLGFLAGQAGLGLRAGSAALGWQRPLSVLAGVLVIVTGLALLGVVPGLGFLGRSDGCGLDRLRGPRWLLTLLRAPGVLPRVLLGATMGLLPCGLVYAMLAVSATLLSPLQAALGMIVFGLGTVPSLSAVLLAGRLLSARLRVHGARLAAVAVIAAGVWMTARTLMTHAGHGPH